MRKEDKHIKGLAASLLVISLVMQIAGTAFARGQAQFIVWELGGMLDAAAFAIIMAILVRNGYDLVSAGFGLLVVAQGFTIAGAANLEHPDFSAYGAGLMIFIPGYLIISAYSGFKWWSRLAGALMCIPFAYEAYQIVNREKIDPSSAINTAGYMLQALAQIGWIIALLKTKAEEKLYE